MTSLSCLLASACAPHSEVQEPAIIQQPVTRSEAEPPGAHCEHGGTAVRVGFDRDGDGQLADGEIADTHYACDRAEQVTLVSVEPEPPGLNCALGGTAVRSGVDLDGDGDLDPSEGRTTQYACAQPEEPPAALTRTDREPAGERCPEGGAALHAGLDLDHDGVLDEAETVSTEYVCSDLVDGDVELSSPADTTRLSGIRVITGDLIIQGAAFEGALALPALEVVGGSLRVEATQLTELSLTRLRSVAEDLAIADNPTLRKALLPELRTVGQDASISDAAALQELALPALRSSASLLVSDAGLTELSLPSLARTGELTLYVLPGLTALRAPALEQVYWQLKLSGLSSLSALELPALQEVGHLRLTGTALADLSGLAALTYARSLVITGNAQLERLELPALASVIGGVTLGAEDAGHASLRGILLPRLFRCHFLIVEQAPELRQLDLSGLLSIERVLVITGAPHLPRCEVDAALAGLASPPQLQTHVVGTDDDARCGD